MDAIHITLIVALAAVIGYGLRLSIKLDRMDEDLDAHVATHKNLVEAHDKMFEEFDELTSSYNALVDSYNELADNMESLEDEGISMLESHRDICQDYIRVARELTRVKTGVASMYPDATHLYKGDIVAEYRAEDVMMRHAKFNANLQKRLDVERQEKA